MLEVKGFELVMATLKVGEELATVIEVANEVKIEASRWKHEQSPSK